MNLPAQRFVVLILPATWVHKVFRVFRILGVLSIPMPPTALLVLAFACGSVHALEHSVTDFRLDSSSASGDKYRLDPAWGDSLLLNAESFRYTSVKTYLLSDTRFDNGDAGASPISASNGPNKFKVCYLSWRGFAHDNSPGAYPPPNSREAPRANIVIRNIDLSADTADIDLSATTLAPMEIIPDPARFLYSNGPPGPTFLNFAAEGDNYAAYWGSGTPSGPVRRTTHKQVMAGAYVTPVTPVTTGGFGKISSALIPGSAGTRTVVAYETDFTTNKFQVRWEDLNAATSVASADYARPVFPEDFAVAGDSDGNVVALWRESADLYAVAFDSAHTEIQPPTLIQAGITYQDGAEHMYRPYAVASLRRNAFMIAYSQVAGAVTNIQTRTVALPGSGGWSVGAPVAVTANHINLYPDIAVSADRAVIGYFQRPIGGVDYRFQGAIMEKSGNTLSFFVGRTDLDFANENINFTATNIKWSRYHCLKTASVSIDAKGNVVAAYDSGSHAKAALVRNTPIYYDTATFQSKILKVENPAIPAFTFNPASDSVDFKLVRSVTTDSFRTVLRLAASPDNAFTGPASDFTAIPMAFRAAKGFYRYRVDMLTLKTGNPTTTNLTTPKVKSLTVEYNVKPWTPVVDSIRVGSSAQAAYNSLTPYALLARKDSLVLVCRGFDADDAGLQFQLSLGSAVLKSAAGARTSPGNYTATLRILPPDTLLNPLVLTLATLDTNGWNSRTVSLGFGFTNIVPSQTVKIFRNRGSDSSSVYLPYGNGVDTLAPVTGGVLYVQETDSLTVKARYADGNDDTVTAEWRRNSTTLGGRRFSVADSANFRFSPDNLAPLIDTLAMSVRDKDTMVTLRVPVRVNRTPAVDSVFHASYKAKDSVWNPGPFDRIKNWGADTGLVIPSGLSTLLQAGVSDADAGDVLMGKWRIWKQPSGCARGNIGCYIQTDSANGLSITRTFGTEERFLTFRVTDPTGAFRERRVWLEYPVLDTSGTGSSGYAAAVRKLSGDIAFTIDAARRDTTVHADISSQGTADLRITSVATKSNDRKWADLKLTWVAGSPPRQDSARFSGATNINALPGGKVVVLAPGAVLSFNFRFFSDSLRGDSVLTDTLLVQTNDFANPVLKIPFRIQYRDLPVATLSVPGAARAGVPGGFNNAGLPRLVPARSSIAVSFSEPVRILKPESLFRVYSLLDSIKRPAGLGTIPGTYAYKRKSTGLGKISAAAAVDSLADTVIFTPKYTKASDSLKVKPNAGYFLYRDVLRIKLSNSITDLAGNALDLRLSKTVLAPGSLDSAFQVRVDTSYFAVVSTQPAQGDSGWDPEMPIRIRFNRKVALGPPAGNDTLTLFTPAALKAVDNRAIRVTSAYRPGRGYDFRMLSLADNDSTLIIGTRPYLPALDTVKLVLSGGILDTSGLSLDGNGNLLPEWLYDQRDTVDQFTLAFITKDADFYVFPNPFRFSDSRHRDKGAITFKNLNSLRGYGRASDVTLRVHTMTGDLVYKTSTSAVIPGEPEKSSHTSLDWNLRNDQGATVGTGVYIFTLMSGKDRVLRKGKVAVVR
ncbi:MAG: hypothetical protein ABIW76_15115 [Fibrobacteria bacterium]